MSYTIILYFVLLIIGGYLSYKKWVTDRLFSKITHIQMACLYALIFIMGIRLGMNETVIASIKTIGFKSLIFALSTTIGSMVIVFIFSQMIINNEVLTGRSKNENNH